MLKRALSIRALETNPYVHRIDIFLFVYIKVFLIKLFLHINEDYNEYHQKKTTCTFIYAQKAKQILKHLYVYKARHFAKSKTMTLYVTFLYAKNN